MHPQCRGYFSESQQIHLYGVHTTHHPLNYVSIVDSWGIVRFEHGEMPQLPQ